MNDHYNNSLSFKSKKSLAAVDKRDTDENGGKYINDTDS